jgi:hypothetical protein
MNDKLIQKSRWFWGWDDDKEEAWLTEMAKNGLHLQSAALFGKYTFAKGEPREMAYRLDFVPANKKDESYFQLFCDAGWEYVGELSGWQYWRKEVKPGEAAEIFTDVDSKIQKYQRLFGFLAIIFLPFFMGMFNMRYLLTSPYTFADWVEGVFVGVGVLVTVMFFLYIYIFIRIGMRIRQLKRL